MSHPYPWRAELFRGKTLVAGRRALSGLWLLYGVVDLIDDAGGEWDTLWLYSPSGRSLALTSQDRLAAAIKWVAREAWENVEAVLGGADATRTP